MTLLERVQSRGLLADGAMGTELQRAGLAPGECGDLWCLTQPARVEAVHRAYCDAGADLIVTNSFGANPWVLERFGAGARVDDVNRAAAAMARRAAGPGRYVLGDIGPTGQLLEPLGPVGADDVRTACARQARALLECGADGIVVETMSDIGEATAAVRGARDAGAAIVVASMTFDRLPNGRLRTMMGVSPEGAADALRAAGADIVGLNCGTRLGDEDLETIVRAMRGAGATTVIAKPNAGEPQWQDGRAVYDLTPDAFAARMHRARDAGAAIVGGCCGTTPAHIAALRAVLDAGARSRGVPPHPSA